MKVVAALLLLGLVIASVVCEPEEPSNEAETERKHRHKHGRGDYHDDDRHDYPNHNSGSYPRNCPTCIKSCSCQQSITPTQVTSNGCANNGGAATCSNPNTNLAGATGLCSTTDFTGTGAGKVCAAGTATCSDPTNLGTGATVASCTGTYTPPGGAAGTPASLCYAITCPSAGFINIKADSVPLQCCGTNVATGVADFLYLYKGTVTTPPTVAATGLTGFSNVMNLDYSAACAKDDLFWVCEKTGIIITSSIKATFTTQDTGITSCPNTSTQLFCRG